MPVTFSKSKDKESMDSRTIKNDKILSTVIQFSRKKITHLKTERFKFFEYIMHQAYNLILSTSI